MKDLKISTKTRKGKINFIMWNAGEEFSNYEDVLELAKMTSPELDKSIRSIKEWYYLKEL